MLSCRRRPFLMTLHFPRLLRLIRTNNASPKTQSFSIFINFASNPAPKSCTVKLFT